MSGSQPDWDWKLLKLLGLPLYLCVVFPRGGSGQWLRASKKELSESCVGLSDPLLETTRYPSTVFSSFDASQEGQPVFKGGGLSQNLCMYLKLAQ
jgi:hypothetical protein